MNIDVCRAQQHNKYAQFNLGDCKLLQVCYVVPNINRAEVRGLAGDFAN